MKMFEGDYIITKKSQFKAIDLGLGKWVRSVLCRGDKLTTPEVLEICKQITYSEFTVSSDDVNCQLESNDLVEVVKIEKPNEWVVALTERDRIFALLERGANGDTEAAVEYCKLKLDGKAYDGAMA